jgi:hypothetical protein
MRWVPAWGTAQAKAPVGMPKNAVCHSSRRDAGGIVHKKNSQAVPPLC